MSSAKTPTVVILGAAHSGIPIAHRLIRSLPSEYKVILVNPSTHFYWNIAAPRIIAKDNQFSAGNADAFVPITPNFASYSPSRFEFIQGKATGLDPKANTVVITPNDDEGRPGTEGSIVYTHLVIATGSSAHGSWPFKPLGSHIQTREAIKDVEVKVEAAKTIVLSGAGATGVETAGELATLWKGSGKKIILLTSGDRPLPMVRVDVGKEAQKQLESLGVVVKKGVRVTEEVEKSGVQQLVLSNGELIQADLHIPTYGLVPNTQFVPPEMLDQSHSVKVTKAMQSTSYENIWVSGDAAAVNHKQVMTVKTMVDCVVHNLLATIEGKGKGTFKEFDDGDTPIVVPVGGKFAMGTGLIGSWKVWGFLVWMLKGRTFFIANAKKAASKP